MRKFESCTFRFMGYKDSDKRKAYAKQHYIDNKEQYKASYKKNITRNKRNRVKFVREQKDKPCIDCGVKYPYWVMQFDHIKGEKKFDLGHAADRAGIAGLKAEIEKCEVVCANCHAERTHKRRAASKVDEQS